MKIEEEIAQQRFESEELKVYINILYTAGWLARRQARFFSTFGLNAQQYNILRILRGQKPQPASIQVLRERMIEKDSNVGRILEKLEKDGFLVRTSSKEDKRQKNIFITEKGLSLLDDIDVYIQSEYGVMSRINKKDITLLNNLLDRLRG